MHCGYCSYGKMIRCWYDDTEFNQNSRYDRINIDTAHDMFMSKRTTNHPTRWFNEFRNATFTNSQLCTCTVNGIIYMLAVMFYFLSVDFSFLYFVSNASSKWWIYIRLCIMAFSFKCFYLFIYFKFPCARCAFFYFLHCFFFLSFTFFRKQTSLGNGRFFCVWPCAKGWWWYRRSAEDEQCM